MAFFVSTWMGTLCMDGCLWAHGLAPLNSLVVLQNSICMLLHWLIAWCTLIGNSLFFGRVEGMHLPALACGCDCLEIHLLAAIVDFGSWLWLCFGHLSPLNGFLCLGWEFAYGCDCLRSTRWLPLLNSVLSFGCALDICLLHTWLSLSWLGLCYSWLLL